MKEFFKNYCLSKIMNPIVAAVMLLSIAGAGFILAGRSNENISCKELAFPEDSVLESILISSLSDSSCAAQKDETESIRYAIKSGDTLDAISRKYNISVDTLIVINDIEDAARLHPGMIIRIPI